MAEAVANVARRVNATVEEEKDTLGKLSQSFDLIDVFVIILQCRPSIMAEAS